MNDASVNLQPAFILHSRKYQESGLILDVLTQDYGKVRLLAKGVRKQKSKLSAILQCFKPINISYVGRNDLKILTGAELIRSFSDLQGLHFYCGFYLNELVQNFLHLYDPHPEVFFDYQGALSELLVGTNVEQTLRLFEFKLLENVGYGLPVHYDYQSGLPIDPEKHYELKLEHGFQEIDAGPYSGAMLISISNGNILNKTELKQAKILFRKIIDWHLDFKKLHSRELIKQHYKYLNHFENV